MHGVKFATKMEAGGARRLKTIAIITATALLVAGCGAPKVRNSGNPKQPGPPEKVLLTWSQSDNAWKVQLNGGPQKDPKTAKTTLAQGTGPTMFIVDINGSTNATFKDPGGLAVWTGSKSAPQSGINSTQILGPVVTKQGKQLVFWDLNQGDPVTLNYGLYFNESGIPPVDPIIDNGGGT